MAKHRTGHLFKRGRTFYVRWAVNGKIFSKALHDAAGNPIKNRREAEDAKLKWLAPFVVADEAASLEAIAAKLEGRKAELTRLNDERNPALTVAHGWSEYLKSANRPDSSESTLGQYEIQFTKFREWLAKTHPAVVALREVTKPVAEAYASHLASRGLSANTYNKHLNLLQLVFRVLKGKARLTENTWKELPRRRLTTQSRREMTVDELRNVCGAAEGELRKLLALGIYSGLRLGDCATLRWGEVDLARGIIRRVPNKTARRSSRPVLVPIHAVLREILADTPPEQRGGYVLPEMAALYLRRVELVTELIQAHFKKCGIQLYQPGTGENGKRAVVEIGFHSLRHTFVSLCRESGAPLAVVEAIVGHSNPAMTRHYTHIGELAAGLAVAALPAVMGKAVPAPAVNGNGPVEILRQVRDLLEGMKAGNWEGKRAEGLALLSKLVEVPDTRRE
ncbi:MAG: tyrosine-type recombinase/integrase [Verrucomicrobia bacterium]|nr:tyrosine-type recombinase/integrase [Verrucomicrobiota bacterium]